MVQITLTNHNIESNYRNASININTGVCILDGELEVKLADLRKNFLFCHPLLEQKKVTPIQGVLHYEYCNIEGLFNSAIFVYSSLLSLDNPNLYQFKINPSPLFEYLSSPTTFFFTSKSTKYAQEKIEKKTLNALVAELSESPFLFSETPFIHSTFTIDDLPDVVDGDWLLTKTLCPNALFKNQKPSNYFDIRYISPLIGLGIFTRVPIKNNEAVFCYVGEQSIHDLANKSYAFIPRKDVLNISIDARESGNLSRFVNHAQKSAKKTNSNDNSLTANLTAESFYVHGMQILVYTASKDIYQGEQLFVDYGPNYFRDNPLKFSPKGKILSWDNKTIRNESKKKCEELKIIAKYNIQSAKTYFFMILLSKASITIFAIILFNFLISMKQ